MHRVLKSSCDFFLLQVRFLKSRRGTCFTDLLSYVVEAADAIVEAEFVRLFDLGMTQTRSRLILLM